MGMKKYLPGTTLTVQILLVVIVAGAIGAIATGQTWIRAKIFGRM